MGPHAAERAPPPVPSDSYISKLLNSVKFVELFAGTGRLTSAVSQEGIPVRSPDEFDFGGTYFRSQAAVDRLKRELVEWAKDAIAKVKKQNIHWASLSDEEAAALIKEGTLLIFLHFGPSMQHLLKSSRQKLAYEGPFKRPASRI